MINFYFNIQFVTKLSATSGHQWQQPTNDECALKYSKALKDTRMTMTNDRIQKQKTEHKKNTGQNTKIQNTKMAACLTIPEKKGRKEMS